MVRAGQMPLDRAHAHARWAERYDAQSEPQRAAAHFGRAMHYAQMVHAFGAPKLEREEGSRDIVVGRWEDGAEVWSTLQHLTYLARMAAATKKRRVHEALHGQGGASSRKPLYAGPAGYDYRELPGMLDKMYASESRGIMGSVHADLRGLWHLHRAGSAGIIYLVPATRLATDANGVSDLVKRVLGRMTMGSAYTIAFEFGLLIVQDQRRGCVQVKRNGVWEPSTEPQTFAYYDFLLRHPSSSREYHSEEKARKPDDKQSSLTEPLKAQWTMIPREYTTAKENGDLSLAIRRNQGLIYVGNIHDFDKSKIQISDVAYRRPS